ncbi:MAG: N-acetyl-alpha-D-glucosaminyl L-malate synthase BshA [Candidatus Carbobacillus altaicus]|nr:N-acetyl-alpha-D-glucosaminyl L-malate synthase BshA [Candidatus Carbobacillus altaicus]
MQQLKIGIACFSGVGGSGVVASQLALALVRRGHEVHIISDAVPFRLNDSHSAMMFHLVEAPSYPAFRNPPWEISLSSKIAQLIDEVALDVVHAHYAIPFALCALWGREMAVKKARVVTTLHGTDISLFASDMSLYAAIRYALLQSDAVTAVSNWLKRETERLFSDGEMHRPIHVIHNFIDPHAHEMRHSGFIDPHAREKQNSSGQATQLIVHVSNFRPIKRVPDLVQAFYRVRQRLPVRLLLIGDGPELAQVKMLAEHLGIKEDIEWVGNVTDVRPYLARADVFVLPSETESFGLSALEAMACGLPVVATKSGGLPEVVVDGETGYLVPVGDIAALAEALLKVLGDWRQAAALGEAGRRRAFKYFALDEKISAYEALYRQVLNA